MSDDGLRHSLEKIASAIRSPRTDHATTLALGTIARGVTDALRNLDGRIAALERKAEADHDDGSNQDST